MIKDKKIGIVLPTYNEEQNIADLLSTIFLYAPSAIVVIVDDSPNEKTALAAKKQIAQLSIEGKSPNYQVVKRIEEKGRASAVRAGFKLLEKENCDYFIEMDTDGSHPPKQLPKLIDAALSNAADIVICSRDIAGSKIIGWPIQRKLLHFLANFSCRLLLRLNIHDYMNAYRIYSKRAIKVVLEDAGKISTGFWAFGESLVHIKVRGGVVKEIPTIFTNRTLGQSQVKLNTILGCGKELLQVLYLLRQLRIQPLSFD